GGLGGGAASRGGGGRPAQAWRRGLAQAAAGSGSGGDPRCSGGGVVTGVELPKWPRLMVRGKNIRPEQADLVILRTTSFTGGVSGGGRKVNSMVRRAFGVQSSLYDDSWYSEWDRAAAEVGALDVHYVHSDRIVSFSAGGPEGWVSW